MVTPDRIRDAASAMLASAVETRRHLHRNPELSFEETATSKFIAGHLREAGIPHQTGIGGHGVVGIIHGDGAASGPGRTIALRADIDALPIRELNDVDYRSTREGVMHACGHDAHTAGLLTAARILNDVKEELPGSVKLIFQPAEERAPGGAGAMISDGVLENPAVSAVIGQHVNPEIAAGKVGFRSGLFMGSVDDIYITVRGKGGHAAKPQLCVDPVVIASNLVLSLQQIVSRNADPTHPTVLSFGYISGAGSNNIIPDTVELAGTMRTFDPVWRDEAIRRVESTTRTIVESLGGTADVRLVRGYPSLSNDEALTTGARAAAESYLGADNVQDVPPALWSEDFAYFARERPSCFYNLGVRNEDSGIVNPVHSPRFDIDESALATGAGLMAWIAVRQLGA